MIRASHEFAEDDDAKLTVGYAKPLAAAAPQTDARRIIVLARAIFLLAAVLLSSPPALGQSAGTPGTGIDIIGHEVEITPDFLAQTLSGQVRVRLKVQQDRLSELIFSKNGFVIDSAELDGEEIAAAASAGGWVFTPRRPLRKGQTVTLQISYHGRPARGVSFGENSVFTSYWACDWMFCSQDSPDDKAPIDIRLIVPAGMKSLSVGKLQWMKTDAAGRTVHFWRESRPFSSYLYGFAAGHFTETVSRQGGFELAYLDAAAPGQNMEALFGTTAAVVRFLEEKAGVRLPTRRYTQLLVRGSEAQEAATYSIIGLKQIEPILKDPHSDWVIVHELAHQWWGNLVTSRSWDHFWLNEGAVVFMTAAWKEHRFGRAAYDAELDIARARLARAREAGFDKPLAFPGPYPNLSVRRAVQYSKGALFMDHLRTLLGERVFWAALSYYTRANAGDTVDSRDFQRAFEKVSGRDLGATFAHWVYGTAPYTAK